MKSLGLALTACDYCPYEKGKLDTVTEGRPCENMGEDSHRQAQEKSLGQIPPCSPQKEPNLLTPQCGLLGSLTGR